MYLCVSKKNLKFEISNYEKNTFTDSYMHV